MARNLLIIRPSAIGDIVMASPMIRAIKTAQPDTRITWLADPSARDLLAGHPLLDHIIFWSRSEWRSMFRKRRYGRLLSEITGLIRELRGQDFDLVLDVQGLLRSRLLAWCSGAKRRFGFKSKEPGRFLMTRIVSRGPDKKRMSSEYRHMMTVMGIDPACFHPEIHLSETDLSNARAAREKASIPGNYAIFCPFTTRPQKHWFEDRWASLAEILSRRLGIGSVILGGPGDAAASARIRSLSPARIWDLAGKTTIGEAAAMISRARLVIGVDTGLTHMGTAFDRPTIALFGATCPYIETENPFTRVCYEPMPCSPCRRRPTCNHEYHCMHVHTAEGIADTGSRLLALYNEADGASSAFPEAG
jgi:heptosyltransferase-1